MAEIWRVWWKVVPVVVLVLAATCGSACELTASALPAEVDEDAVRRVGHFLWREVDMEGGEREMGDRDGYRCQRPSRRVIYSSIPCIHTANNMNPLHTQSRALLHVLSLSPHAPSPLSLPSYSTLVLRTFFQLFWVSWSIAVDADRRLMARSVRIISRRGGDTCSILSARKPILSTRRID